MSHTWMSHVTHMNEPCHTYEWVVSILRMRDMSHIPTIHVTRINESCHTYRCSSSLSRSSQLERLWVFFFVSFFLGSIHTRMTHSYLCQYSFMTHLWCEYVFLFVFGAQTGRIVSCFFCSRVWQTPLICETWLIHVQPAGRIVSHELIQATHDLSVWQIVHVTHQWQHCDSFVWHDSRVWVTWRVHMCDMRWDIRMWDMTQRWTWHDSFMCNQLPRF